MNKLDIWLTKHDLKYVDVSRSVIICSFYNIIIYVYES